MSEFKEYLLFGGNVFYASGGWKDFMTLSHYIQDLIPLAETADIQWAHIVEMGLEESLFHFRVKFVGKREKEFDEKSKMIWSDKFDFSESN